MIATVKLYYNTGLTPSNCLDSITKLDSLGFESRSCPSVAILQDRGRVNIKINMQWDNVKDADYCVINNNGYWITGIGMLNENAAQLELQQDYLTTIGIDNINIVAGWCTRRHVTNDTLWSNTIDEPFTPSSILKVDGMNEINNGGGSGHINILLCNIELDSLEDVAKAYTHVVTDATGSTSEDSVLVPQLPSSSGDYTKYYSHPFGVSNILSTTIPVTTAYNPNSEETREQLSQVRSLGIESAVGASYQLPNYWVNDVSEDSTNKYATLTDNWGIITSKISPTWGSYKNKKVYSGQFQKYIAYSICSGDKAEFDVEDIINSNGGISWLMFADLRYSGYPSCRPSSFKGNTNNSMIGLIRGANWQQTPFMYTQASGTALAAAGVAQNSVETLRGTVQQVPAQLGNMAMTIAPAAMTLNGMNAATTAEAASHLGIAGSGGLSAVQYTNLRNAGLAYNSQIVAGMYGAGLMNMGSGLNSTAAGWVNTAFNIGHNTLVGMQNAVTNLIPQIQFPIIPQLQDYVGNKFYEMRYRLSDADMTRFDNFLTQFGYAVSEKLTSDCFKGRTHFNYIKATDVDIKANAPTYLRMGAITQIEAGVRVWHTIPTTDALTNNPIA